MKVDKYDDRKLQDDAAPRPPSEKNFERDASGRPLPPDQSPDGSFDREVDAVRIVKWVVGLGVVAALTFGVSAVIVKGWADHARKTDTPPSPFAGELRTREITDPRIQTDKFSDIRELRREEEQGLEHYGWLDRRMGVARIPVERAIEIMAARGGESPFPATAGSAQDQAAAAATGGAAPAASTPAPPPAPGAHP